ncbi:MAG: decaprenyl-phosphate phosphoribosyltransferase [Flavobacteriaceae bacterium]|nr:MAG: decaprenyl-phosphate phosphoribosyltransferase [Flavobacteriaceae bacterium]
MKKYIDLMRVKQWVKNVFVFIPVFFSGQIVHEASIVQSIVGFFLFSLAASCVYIINDYNDIEKDRLHPQKKHRPLASGAISKSEALVLLAILLTILAVCLFVFSNLKTNLLIGAYLLLNVAYSMFLKNLALVDVMVVSLGFLLRVLVGGYITGILISSWTVILTLFLALLMALGKRRGEFVHGESGLTRKALKGYNLQFLDVSLGMVSGVFLVCYLMFCMQPSSMERYGGYMHYSIIFVVLGILRYLQQAIVFNKVESPTKMVYKDRFLQVILLCFGLYFFLLIYCR